MESAFTFRAALLDSDCGGRVSLFERIPHVVLPPGGLQGWEKTVGDITAGVVPARSGQF